MKINLKRICVPTDFSEPSEHSLDYAVTLAKQFGAIVHLIHVVQDVLPTVPEPGLAILPTEEIIRTLEKGASEGLDKLGVKIANEGIEILKAVRIGVPFREIIRYSKEQEIDLLVLSTHGRTGLVHFLLGSVTERVIRSAPCPVLTVRSPEHEFVVP